MPELRWCMRENGVLTPYSPPTSSDALEYANDLLADSGEFSCVKTDARLKDMANVKAVLSAASYNTNTNDYRIDKINELQAKQAELLSEEMKLCTDLFADKDFLDKSVKELQDITVNMNDSLTRSYIGARIRQLRQESAAAYTRNKVTKCE